jgi:hypothetical protein
MRLKLNHHRDTSKLNELVRLCEERAARCRALDGRLQDLGVTIQHPEFKQSRASRRMGGAGVYQVHKERAEHLDRVERLLLGHLAVLLETDRATFDGSTP